MEVIIQLIAQNGQMTNAQIEQALSTEKPNTVRSWLKRMVEGEMLERSQDGLVLSCVD